jgi:hypothetical protein
VGCSLRSAQSVFIGEGWIPGPTAPPVLFGGAFSTVSRRPMSAVLFAKALEFGRSLKENGAIHGAASESKVMKRVTV